MANAGMSPAALARCKMLVIEKVKDSDNFRVELKVGDPRRPGQVIEKHVVRIASDVTRLERALMGKYRIPKEKVTRVGFDGDPAI